MRTITGGDPLSIIVSAGDPGAGGAHQRYRIFRKIPVGQGEEDQFVPSMIQFQEGPVPEVGVNGCQQEDLLAIVIDRLEAFQRGPFACHENAMALHNCREALQWLDYRTENRRRRGVEGTMKR